MALDDVGMLDDYRILSRIDGKYPAALASIAAGHHFHLIALAKQNGVPFCLVCAHRFTRLPERARQFS